MHTPKELHKYEAALVKAGFTPVTIGRHRAAALLGLTTNQAQMLLRELRQGESYKRPVVIVPDALADAVLAALKAAKGKATLVDIADALDRSPASVGTALDTLKAKGHNVSVRAAGAVELSNDFAPGGQITHKLTDYKHRIRKFGVCGDKHLCNRQARLDVLNALYDIYADEGITEVYDTGNWIDGEARFNKSELLVFGMDAQIDYWIDKHPRRNGVTTYFIAGDDHEGWYQQRECIEIGRYAMMRAQAQGRNDLVYLGYVEAHVKLECEKGSRNMMVNHPGGGSAYAISYKGQKYVEALQGGEKPAIVLQGHYHKANFGYPREVFVVDTGTCCDQTLFMRKKMLQAHVGGWVIEMNQAPDGTINRFKPEFIPFYDRGYYTGKMRNFVR